MTSMVDCAFVRTDAVSKDVKEEIGRASKRNSLKACIGIERFAKFNRACGRNYYWIRRYLLIVILIIMLLILTINEEFIQCLDQIQLFQGSSQLHNCKT